LTPFSKNSEETFEGGDKALTAATKNKKLRSTLTIEALGFYAFTYRIR
jgi:hypothetical protein